MRHVDVATLRNADPSYHKFQREGEKEEDWEGPKSNLWMEYGLPRYFYTTYMVTRKGDLYAGGCYRNVPANCCPRLKTGATEVAETYWAVP